MTSEKQKKVNSFQRQNKVLVTFVTVERKSAAWLSEVVRQVRRAKSSAADLDISAAFRFNPARRASPPARSLAGSTLLGMVASACEIAPESPNPPASHIICRTSMAVLRVGPWPWLGPPPAGGAAWPCKLGVEGPVLRPEEAFSGRLGIFLFAADVGG